MYDLVKQLAGVPLPTKVEGFPRQLCQITGGYDTSVEPVTAAELRDAITAALAANCSVDLPISTGDGVILAVSLVERNGQRQILLSRMP